MTAPRLRWWEVVFVALALGYLLGFVVYTTRHPRAIAEVITGWVG